MFLTIIGVSEHAVFHFQTDESKIAHCAAKMIAIVTFK